MPIEQIRTSRTGIGVRTGTNTKASGKYAVAYGFTTRAPGTASAAFGNFSASTASNSFAAGSSSTASGGNSIASGFANTASGANSTALGDHSTASGASAIAAGSYAIASGPQSFAAGSYPEASQYYSVAFGDHTVSTGYGSLAAGNCSSAGGTGAVALGDGVDASGEYAVATGYNSAASRHGQMSHAAGSFAADGDAQHSRLVARKQTTTAAATELALDAGSEYLTIDASRTMACTIKIAAHRTDVSGTAAAWPAITCGITRDATGNCRLLGSVAGAGTTTMCDAGASTWSVAVTADATNNRLAITVTGEASKTIRWVATVDMAEAG